MGNSQGVSPQDYEIYTRYMQSQPDAKLNSLPANIPSPPNGYAKGGLVSQINPLYTYQVGMRNIHQLDDAPPIQNGILPSAPPPSDPLQPIGLGSLVPQQPGNPVVPQQIGKQSYATGGVVGLTGVQQRMAQAMRYYTSIGYTPAQAAGIVGNLTAESNLNPLAAGDKVNGQATSFGMMQAHNDRAQALRNYGGQNWQDFDTQLGFVHHELGGPESAAGKALANAQDVTQATQAMIGYERPSGWTANNPTAGHNYAGRLNYANQAYSLYTGNPAAATVANVSPDITNSAQANQLAAAAPAAQGAAQAMQNAQAMQTADADPFGGLMGLLAMSQQQDAPAPAPAPTVRKAQSVDPDYQTAITSQTPDAYAAYLQRRRMMMGA